VEITQKELGSATKLLPDLPSAFCAAFGVTVISLVGRARTERGSALFWGGYYAGVSFSLSWVCKEANYYLAPFCLAPQNAATPVLLTCQPLHALPQYQPKAPR
jgi:hypothetical protein